VRVPFTPFPPCPPNIGGPPYTVECDGRVVFSGSEFWARVFVQLWRPFTKSGPFLFDCGGRQTA
jgi:hypothetical protein